MAFSWIGTVFFVDFGAKIIFDSNLLLGVLPYAAALLVGLFIVQVRLAGLAARFIGGGRISRLPGCAANQAVLRNG